MLHTLLTISSPGSPDPFRRELIRSGFRCYGVRSLPAALTALEQWDFDAVLLNACSNREEPLATLRALKTFSRSPVLALLPKEADECWYFDVLDAGADQFLSDSASARLIAAQLTRLVGLTRPRMHRATDVRVGPLSLDVRHSHAFVDGRMLQLTRGEFALLLALASEAGKPVHRETLAASVQVSASHARRRSVDMLVCRVRRKLRELAGDALELQTVYGRGYLLRPANHEPEEVAVLEEGWTI
ncbi:MAG TPA: winged helix-turn-helix domain-containing protein [Burkholderiaceae bacterium]